MKGYKPTDKERALSLLLSIGRTSGGTVIKVEAGISFFGADPVNLSLDYTPTKKYFNGKIEFEYVKDRVPRLPTIELTYRNGCFSFKG